jgi:hypothetical protein
MLRPIARGIVLAALGALAGACGSTTTPVTPTPVTVTEMFSGTLSPASSNTHAFLTQTGGTVTATLTTIAPDATINIGFSVGTFNPTLNTCTTVLDNPAALQAFAFNATASTLGYYCVRVYDNGNVKTATDAGTVSDATPFAYTITVVHP